MNIIKSKQLRNILDNQQVDYETLTFRRHIRVVMAKLKGIDTSEPLPGEDDVNKAIAYIVRR